MIAGAIHFTLAHLPLIAITAAFLIAALRPQPNFSVALLNWLLLLAVGVESLWAGMFHTLFPRIAAASIGWQVSPFQFEIGVADAALGVVAIVSFWRSLDFKGAVVGYATLFYLGVTIGHVHEAVVAGNFAANNFGPLLAVTVLRMMLLPLLYLAARRQAAAAGQPAFQ